jgi:hypothetical protein
MFDPHKLNQFVVISLFGDEDGKQNAKKQSFAPSTILLLLIGGSF